MEHTGHVMLVGEGAERFAVAMGFPRENLLTERSRKIWLLWKEFNSDVTGGGPGLPIRTGSPPSDGFETASRVCGANASSNWQQRAADLGIEPEFRLGGRAARAVSAHRNDPLLGAERKGRNVGHHDDQRAGVQAARAAAAIRPIIGAGCYTDQDVGSAGATGSGEENIKVAGAHTIVENMRHGMSPQEAGMDALKRIVRNYNGDMNKLRFMDMTYYILRKDGAYAGVCLWEGYSAGNPHKFAVHDGTLRSEVSTPLLKGFSQEWPPIPVVPEELKKDSEYLK